MLPFVAGFGIGLLLVPAITWASHQYSDVPNSHTFHNAITALTDTGIASGTGGGLFKPQDPVTRGQMAAFIHRSAGRIAFDATLESLPTGGAETLLGSAAMQLIGPTGGTQAILVEVATQLDHDLAVDLDCSAAFLLKRAGSPDPVEVWFVEVYDDDSAHEEGLAWAWVITQGSGTTVTYELYGQNTCSQVLHTDEDIMTVRNIPFTGTGSAPSLTEFSTLGVEQNREE